MAPFFSVKNRLSQAFLTTIESRSAGESVQSEILGINASVTAVAQAIPPVVAGYLAAQMHAFKAQTRGDPDALGYMWGMSAPLDDEMINALAAYYAGQSPGPGAGGDAAAIARGAEIYAKGIANDGIPPCAGCHGPNAAGTADFPRLAGQHAQYILKQLRSFQSNLRDVAVMHGVAQSMAVGEMESVAAYLESLGGT